VFQRLIKKIATALHANKIHYMIVGGQALLLYGEPRLTKDIDITMDLGLESLDNIKKIVSSLKLKILVKDVNNFVKKTMVLPVIDEATGIRVDFIFSFSAYEKKAIQRAKEVKIGKTMVKFAALEDLIIHKIIAGRPRDIADIKSVLLKNPRIDKRYITYWLRQFDKSLNEKFVMVFQKILKG